MRKKVVVILSVAIVMILLALYIDSYDNTAVNNAVLSGEQADIGGVALAEEMGELIQSFQKIKFLVIGIIISMTMYIFVLLWGLSLISRRRSNKMKKSVPVETQTQIRQYDEVNINERPDLRAAVKVEGANIGNERIIEVSSVDIIAQRNDAPEITEEIQIQQDDLPNGGLEYIEADSIDEIDFDYGDKKVTGNLFAKALINVTGADIAFINSGGIRCTLNPDSITEADVIRAFPFDDTVTVQGLTGAQIKAVLEHSACMLPDKDDRSLHISGVTVELDISMPTGERVVSVTLPDGTPLSSDTEYIVAANDYVASGGDGYEILAALPKMTEGQTVVQAVMKYIADITTEDFCESEDLKVLSAQY